MDLLKEGRVWADHAEYSQVAWYNVCHRLYDHNQEDTSPPLRLSHTRDSQLTTRGKGKRHCADRSSENENVAPPSSGPRPLLYDYNIATSIDFEEDIVPKPGYDYTSL